MATSVTLCRWKLPVEREFKYVLRLADEVELAFANPDDNQHISIGHKFIRQGYMGENARIRSVQFCHLVNGVSHVEDDPHRDVYYFTFKKFVEGRGVIEIETQISKDDFDALWPSTNNRLVKRRYTRQMVDKTWDVDFFINDGHTYFAMAECELLRDDADPLILIPQVEDSVIYAVDEHDTRFTSHALSDPAWAAKLMQEIAA